MTKITVYQKPTCATCRQVHAALKENGVDFTEVNYHTDPISKAKLKELLEKMAVSADDLLRKKEAIYKELDFGNKKHSQNEAIDLMVKYPDLIQRPIVEYGDKAILARPADRVLDILSSI